MRKLIAVGLMFMASSVFAAQVFAAQDDRGSMRPALWRASSTCAALNHFVLTTGTIHLHAISVDSATVNQGNTSIVALFDSTSAPNTNTRANYPSTTTRLVPNFEGLSATSGGSLNWPPFVYDQKFSTGIVVNKAGLACVTFYWDFVVPKVDPLYPWVPKP